MARENEHILLEFHVTNNGPLRYAEEDVGMSNAFYAGRGAVRQLSLMSEFNKLLGSTPIKTTLNVVLNAGDQGLDAHLGVYNWRNRQIKSLYGVGVDYAGYDTIFDGVVRFPEGMKRSNRRIAFVADDIRSKDTKLLPETLFTEEAYSNAPMSTIGKPIPILWGEYAHPLLITPPCIDNTETDGLKFKISGDTIMAIGDLYIIEEDGTKTKRNLEYVDGAKDLTNAEFRAAGLHLQESLKDINADADKIYSYCDDGTYLYAVVKATSSKTMIFRWDGDEWTYRGQSGTSAEFVPVPKASVCNGLGVIYVGCATGGVLIFTGGGTAYGMEVPEGGLTGETINCLAVYQSNVYCGTLGIDAYEGQGEVWKRTAPETWVCIWRSSAVSKSGPVLSMCVIFRLLLFGCSGIGDPVANAYLVSWDGTDASVEYSFGMNLSWMCPGVRYSELVFGDTQNIYTWDGSDFRAIDAVSSGTIQGVAYDPNREAVYFTVEDSGEPPYSSVYKWKGGQLDALWTGTDDLTGYVYGCHFWDDYILWSVQSKVLCNSLLTSDEQPTRLTGKFGIEATGRFETIEEVDVPIEEPTDIYTNVLESDLGVHAGNIDSASITIVQNALTDSGGGEFKVHRYLDRQMQAADLLSELCAECEISPSIRDNKYNLQYMWPSGSSGATFHSKVFREQHLKDKTFDTTDCPDYFNKFSMLHKHDPCTGNFEGTEIQEAGAAQAADRTTITRDLSCLWRYNDADHISVFTFVQNLITFFSMNPEWVSTTLKDTLDVELGDVVDIEIGHLTNVPVLVRSIRKDFLAKQTRIQGWNLRTVGIYTDTFWNLRDGKEINPQNYPALEKPHPGIAVALHGWYVHMRCQARRVHFKFKITGDFTDIESDSFYCPSNGGIDYDVTLGAAINGLPDGTYAMVEIWAAAIVPSVARIWDVHFEMTGPR